MAEIWASCVTLSPRLSTQRRCRGLVCGGTRRAVGGGKVPEAHVKPLLCAALSGRQAPPGWLQGRSRRPEPRRSVSCDAVVSVVFRLKKVKQLTIRGRTIYAALVSGLFSGCHRLFLFTYS